MRPVQAAAISSRARVPPTGKPFATPLATTMMSGSTSQCSIPNQRSPVRPNPACTSSQMNTPPYARITSAARLWYPGGGTM